MQVIALAPIKETTEDYEGIEKAIRTLFAKEIYLPILLELVPDRRANMRRTVLKNSQLSGLLESIRQGAITFSQGVFSGRFNSNIVKDLRKIGARFNRRDGTYRLKIADMPLNVRMAVSASEAKFREKIERIDKKLGDIITDEISGRGISKKLKVDHFFDRALWKVEKNFQSSVRGLTIAPQLSPEQRKRIADEWGNNMQLWIQDFAEKEIKELRMKMHQTVFSGDRYGTAIKTIQESYGTTANKAKFLARQETSLLMTKFKQTRYQAVGVEWYRWGCVAGSKNHPVRRWHRDLEGKVFRWDDPPVTTKPGMSQRKNNPGQDYNCRCFARPLVGYKPGRIPNR